MADNIYTRDNWDLDFYKPEDLMGNTDASAWVTRDAAKRANDLAKEFYETTGKKVSVNLPHGFGGPDEGVEGKRRGTRDPLYMPPGAAKNSRHLHGDAFDFQIQHLSDDEKRKYLDLATKKYGFQGVGFYSAGQGGHLHLDLGKTREWGSRPTWANDWNRNGIPDNQEMKVPAQNLKQDFGGQKRTTAVTIPDEVTSSINEAAKRVGVDPRWMAAHAHSESTYRTGLAAKTSSAYGLFQYTKGNWEDHVKRYSKNFPEIGEWDRTNPRHQAMLYASFMKDQKEKLSADLGTDATEVDIYGAHHFGPTGYRRFLAGMKENPNAPAYEFASREAVKANRAVFFHDKGRGAPKTYAELGDWLRTRATEAPGWDEKKSHEKQLAIEASSVGSKAGSAVLAARTGVTPAVAKADARLAVATGMAEGRAQRDAEIAAQRAPGEGPVGSQDIFMPSVYTSRVAVGLDEKRREERQAQANLGMWDTATAAIQNNWSYYHMFKGHEHMQPQPNYIPSKEMITQTLKDGSLDDKYAGILATAESDAQYSRLTDWAKQHQANAKIINDAGWTGVAMNLAAAMTDPIDIAVMAATFGTGNFALKGSKIMQSAPRLASAGVGAAGGMNAAAMHLFAGDPDYSLKDVGFAAAFGAGIGALFGPGSVGLGKAEAVRSAQAAASLMRKLDAQYAESVARGSSVGAAVNPNAPLEVISDAALSKLVDEAFPELEGVGKGFRFDLGGYFSNHKSPVVRAFGSTLIKDPVGRRGNKLNPISVDEERLQSAATAATRFAQSKRAKFGAYLEEQGINPILSPRQAAKARAEFNDSVTMYMREPDPNAKALYSKHVQAFGDDVKQILEEWRVKQADPGNGLPGTKPVYGWDTITPNDNYITRMWDAQKIRNFVSTHGSGALRNMIREAVLEAQSDIVERMGKRYFDALVEGFAKSVNRRSHGVSDDLHRAMGGIDEDALRGILREGGITSQEEISDALKKILSKRGDDSGKAAPAKRRVLMDETKKFQVGKNGEEVSIQDLLVNDIDDLFKAYNRGASARYALARWKIKNPMYDDMVKKGILDPNDPKDAAQEFLLSGVTKESDFQSVLNKMDEFNHKLVEEKKITAEEAKEARVKLQFVYDYMMGRMEVPEGQMADAVRMFRKFNFFRLMNMVGFAQVAEFGIATNKVGLGAMFTHMPAFRRIFKDGKSVLASGLDEEIETLIGVGSHELLNSSFARFDDMYGGSINSLSRGTAMQKVEAGLDQLQGFTGKYSGMNVITGMSQRWAAKSIAQRIANLSAKAGNLSKRDRNMIHSLGIDDEIKTTYRVKTPDTLAGDQMKKILHKYGFDDIEIRKSGGLGTSKAQLQHALEETKIADAIKKMLPEDAEKFKSLRKKFDEAAESMDGYAEKQGTMLDRIIDQLNAHSSTEQGMFSNRKIKLLNLDEWADQEAREAFEMALFRGARQIIQENDVGMMAKWMSTPLAGIILQFRTFMMGAHSNALLHNLHTAGMLPGSGGTSPDQVLHALGMAFSTMMLGGMAYAAQTWSKTIGRDDRDAILEREFKMENLARAAFTRASWSGLFPTLVDATVAPAMTAAVTGAPQSFFSYRNTGQPTDLLFGNPTVGYYNDLMGTLTAAGSAIGQGRGLSQPEARKAMGLVLPNALPVQWISNLMIGERGLDLMERTPRPPRVQ